MLVCATLAFLAGCSATPVSEPMMNHFNSARDDARHSQCMRKHTMFNNRQLMVAPNAVENAWTYCIKQADVWYPGKSKNQKQSEKTGWESQ